MADWVVEIETGNDKLPKKRIEIHNVKNVENLESGQMLFTGGDTWGGDTLSATFYRPIAAWNKSHCIEFGSNFNLQDISRWITILRQERKDIPETLTYEEENGETTTEEVVYEKAVFDAWEANQIADFLQTLIE